MQVNRIYVFTFVSDLILTILIACSCGICWFCAYSIQVCKLYSQFSDSYDFFLYLYIHSITCVLCCLVPLERLVINKERLAGWYRLSAYYLAKMTSELVLILVQPLFFITVVYWSVGLNGVSSYFATLGTLFIHAITGQVI